VCVRVCLCVFVFVLWFSSIFLCVFVICVCSRSICVGRMMHCHLEHGGSPKIFYCGIVDLFVCVCVCVCTTDERVLR